MPWVPLPPEFHPIDRAFIGKIRYRQNVPSNPHSGYIYPVVVSGFEINAGHEVPELTVSRPADDFMGVYPQEFLGALIFRGDNYIGAFEFSSQRGQLNIQMNPEDFLFPGKKSFFGGVKPAGNDHRTYGEVLPYVLSWLNSWLKSFSTPQSNGGRL